MKAAYPALLAALLIGGCGEEANAPANQSGNQASAADPAPAAAQPAAWVLTDEGLGPLRVGMTVEQVRIAAGPDSDPKAAGGADPEACDQFRPARAPDGVLVMIEDGWLTRVSLIRNSPVKTDRGLAVGASAADVQRTYGEALVRSPHKYADAPASYLDHWSRNGPKGGAYTDDQAARGIRYEIGSDGRVQAIHAGGPSIQYVEGCS